MGADLFEVAELAEKSDGQSAVHKAIMNHKVAYAKEGHADPHAKCEGCAERGCGFAAVDDQDNRDGSVAGGEHVIPLKGSGWLMV